MKTEFRSLSGRGPATAQQFLVDDEKVCAVAGGKERTAESEALISPLILSWPRLLQLLAASKGRRAITQRRRSGVRSSTASKVLTADLAAGISDSLARPANCCARNFSPQRLKTDFFDGQYHGQKGKQLLSIFTLDFCHRPGRASALVCRAALKLVGDGRVKVAANCIGDLSNIFTAGLIPLMRPDGHSQNLALAVRIGAAFRKVFCRRFRLASNFLWFFAVRHKSPRFRMRWQGQAPGGVKIES
ncbi:MAG TPA: hypothetical protein VH024_13405 [Candidatus Angelobacter sp.]|nr:hypothetical protein [Candidatus Angelobacter sp.]